MLYILSRDEFITNKNDNAAKLSQQRIRNTKADIFHINCRTELQLSCSL